MQQEANEQAFESLFEKIMDPTDEIYLQDAKGRVFKIALYEGQGGNLEELQQNFEDEGNNSGHYNQSPMIMGFPDQQQVLFAQDPSMQHFSPQFATGGMISSPLVMNTFEVDTHQQQPALTEWRLPEEPA